MRLRNIKGASEFVSNNPYVILNYENYKGNFKNVFKNDNPIYLEIGTGKGDFIIGNALKYPNINFIGIEKYDSVLYRALEKLENVNLPNLKFIRMDATSIDNVFDKEIDILYLNFSDPWPKDRHYKRRLTSEFFLAKYEKIFKGDRRIIQKTDNRHLFEFSLEQFVNFGYKINKVSLDLHQDDISDNIETEYEHKFCLKGNPIYKVDVFKSDNKCK